MTDIAAIFHWALADMEAMDLNELVNWRNRAVEWHNQVHGAKRNG